MKAGRKQLGGIMKGGVGGKLNRGRVLPGL